MTQSRGGGRKLITRIFESNQEATFLQVRLFVLEIFTPALSAARGVAGKQPVL